MEKSVVRISLEAGAYIALAGLIAWFTGRPFLFPSLGPTALALTMHPEENPARSVIGGHLCGVVCGLLAYHVVAPGLTVTDVHAAYSTSGLWLAASGALSVLLTAGSMVALRMVHSPACATTLIVSLGFLPSLIDGAIIMIAVLVLYGAHRVGAHVRQGRGGGRPR